MYLEEDYIQLSAIQHYVFCPRQCALIHVEGLWAENAFTARGKVLHARVDAAEDETHGNVRTVRGLNVFSRRLGLSGKCDVVEFQDTEGVSVPHPVEYKSGMPKMDICDLAQVCAQALCLEETLNVPVRRATIYYGRPRRRLSVELDDELRRRTEEIISSVHAMVSSRTVPAAKRMRKCRSCSMLDNCMPGAGERRLQSYIKELYAINEKAP